MRDDFYADNAEWYGALVAAWQEGTETGVRALLGTISGDVVDIASGVGSCLPLLRGLGAERLFAVEPSQSMRAGLMTTVASDSDLMARTTVIAAAFPDALDQLPPQWSAVVMLNAIGHLDEENRGRLWSALRDRLVPGACFVVSLQPPDKVTAIPWTDFGTVRVGEHRLQTRGRAEPLDDARVVWTMEWSLRDAAGQILVTRSATHAWWALSRADLTAEAAARGLTPVDGPAAGHLFAFRQPERQATAQRRRAAEDLI